jgi:hypothetical protein
MSKKSIFVAVVAFAFIAIAFFVTVGFKHVEDEKEIQAVKSTALKAAELNQTLPVVTETNDDKPKFSDDVKSAHKKKINDELGKVLSDKEGLFSKRKGQLEGSILAQETTNFRALKGGILNPEFIAISINGDNAYVEANMTTFSEMKNYDGKGNSYISQPQNRAKHCFTLVKENGVWKVVKHTFDFLAGQEP